MIRTSLLALATMFVLTLSSAAHPPYPFPQAPVPNPSPLSIDGVWYFRGNPTQPCWIRRVQTPVGMRIVLTNEKGTRAVGKLSWDGRKVLVYDWKIAGDYRGDAIIWPNGDFWSR